MQREENTSRANSQSLIQPANEPNKTIVELLRERGFFDSVKPETKR